MCCGHTLGKVGRAGKLRSTSQDSKMWKGSCEADGILKVWKQKEETSSLDCSFLRSGMQLPIGPPNCYFKSRDLMIFFPPPPNLLLLYSASHGSPSIYPAIQSRINLDFISSVSNWSLSCIAEWQGLFLRNASLGDFTIMWTSRV
jgi:hypothetical protein